MMISECSYANLPADIHYVEGHYQAPIMDRRCFLRPIQPTAADYNGRDDVEFGSGCNGWITLAQTRHLHHASKPNGKPASPWNRDLETVRGNATRAPQLRLNRRENSAPNTVLRQNDRRRTASTIVITLPERPAMVDLETSRVIG